MGRIQIPMICDVLIPYYPFRNEQHALGGFLEEGGTESIAFVQPCQHYVSQGNKQFLASWTIFRAECLVFPSLGGHQRLALLILQDEVVMLFPSCDGSAKHIPHKLHGRIVLSTPSGRHQGHRCHQDFSLYASACLRGFQLGSLASGSMLCFLQSSLCIVDFSSSANSHAQYRAAFRGWFTRFAAGELSETAHEQDDCQGDFRRLGYGYCAPRGWVHCAVHVGYVRAVFCGEAPC